MPHENAAAAPGVTGANEAASTSSGQATGESSAATSSSIPDTDASAILQQAGVPDEVVQALQGTEDKGQRTEDGPSTSSGQVDQPQEEEPKAEAEAEGAQAQKEEETEPEAPGPEPENEEPKAEEEEPEGEQPAWFKKRQGKWARQKQRLQDEIDDLREQIQGKPKVEEEQRPEVSSDGEDAFANVKDFRELEKKVEAQRALRDWCLKNPDGTVLAAGTEQERVIGPEQVREWLVGSTRVIEDAPKAAANLQRRFQDAQVAQQWHDLATNEWPELFDRTSEVYQASQTFLQQYPEINRNPNRDFLLGLMVEGWKTFQPRMLARQNAANGNGQSPKSESIPEALKRKIPPIPKTAAPNPPRGSRSRSPQDDAAAAVERLAREGGSQEAAMAAIAAIERQNAVSGDTKRMPAPV